MRESTRNAAYVFGACLCGAAGVSAAYARTLEQLSISGALLIVAFLWLALLTLIDRRRP